jgi:LmbE family N-acetylglucosaminyl deacetylase
MIDSDKVVTAAQLAAQREVEAQQSIIAAANEARSQGLLRALEVVAKQVIDVETLDDTDEQAISALYPWWVPGVSLAVNDIVAYQSVLWRCIQAHTTQSDWAPEAVPALFVRVREPQGNTPLQWVAGEQVAVNDVRVYQGVSYRVIQAHTTQAGWEPPNVPALWTAV